LSAQAVREAPVVSAWEGRWKGSPYRVLTAALNFGKLEKLQKIKKKQQLN
jgi:hypothetical protein